MKIQNSTLRRNIRLTSGIFSTLVLLFVLLGSFCNFKEKPIHDTTNKSGYSPFIPIEINFCGEPVPISYFDVLESLERELLVNTYWHSNTIMLLKKAPRFFKEIEPILKANKVPDDFKYMMVAESGLLDVASPAGAAGQWHFLEETAREYDLEVNDEVDERYNLEKSTEAACKYLLKSYEKYKNWTLVAASYNGGRRGIDRQIEKQGETSYFDLLFAEETGRYVYRIIALKLIFESPETYDFQLSKEEIYPIIPYQLIRVDSSISDIGAFARAYGTNYKILKMLNPWLRDKQLTNLRKKEYIIKVPLNNSREIK